MVRIFTIACPKCNKKFQAHYEELRHKDIKLHCPYCENWFLQEESNDIDDRS
jgi:DNA-directed RNA polymerase subunit RPC12/RpoP